MPRFAGPNQTYKVDKYFRDEEGNPVPGMNRRTMMSKAYKAFLKGKTYYTYKGKQYVVPVFKKGANGKT